MSYWFIIVMTVSTLLVLYLGWRLINPLRIARSRKITLWSLLALLLFGHRLTWVLHRTNRYELIVCDCIDWVGFTFLGFISILVVFMLARDIPSLFGALMSGLKRLFTRRSQRPYFIGPNHARRRFLLNASNGLFLAAALPMTGFGVYNARRKPSVLKNDLFVLDLPEGLDGFTIAQISDTHIGPTIRADWARKVVDAVNGLDPDLIVHTGDMVDGAVDGLKTDVLPFGDLNAPHGVWFCTGNHEYYSGVFEWLSEARRLGIRPLVNEHALIDTGRGRLLLAGVTDLRAGRMVPGHVSSPSKAMAEAPEHDVSVLLAHQPDSVYAASEAGFDIQLSGHTHGGQYFPYNYVIHLFQTFVRGPYIHDGTQLYVNMGTGYWGPPMRIGTMPEITLHTLRRA
ncbi:metallophosphoesterase [Pseudodesulfovibrio thermohalotolerans]|uniref:metallophosphoesterase n=1 Tax=Pseudodesulfovibrio thermohalotolerans TaxID=2880651 RepID=UPI0022BA0FDB|nr:metallophosphoesterase [Pseudodesulfovibrio thermohalotolerans]WFS63554.1 metallophosphoesterase [Pseudodesulfovibrio thermohalotolerans]